MKTLLNVMKKKKKKISLSHPELYKVSSAMIAYRSKDLKQGKLEVFCNQYLLHTRDVRNELLISIWRLQISS